MPNHPTPKEPPPGSTASACLETTEAILEKLEALRDEAIGQPVEGRNMGRVTAINDCIHRVHIVQHGIYYGRKESDE